MRTPYPYSEEEITQRIEQYRQMPLRHFTEQEAYRFIISILDLTSLEGNDNSESIETLCQKAIALNDTARNIKSPAAVCLYSPFIAQAKQLLQDNEIRVATVAAAFPSGQAPLSVKLEEIHYAVEQGADEIDIVISRGKFLLGNEQEVFDEIVAMRNICPNQTLKVILETGELQTADNIHKASQLAMSAGADFIKTSTGKIKENATPRSFLIMLDAIAQHYHHHHKMIGIKPAGGITDGETALLYLKILENVLGQTWLSPQYFRIGASRLADTILGLIE